MYVCMYVYICIYTHSNIQYILYTIYIYILFIVKLNLPPGDGFAIRRGPFLCVGWAAALLGRKPQSTGRPQCYIM